MRSGRALSARAQMNMYHPDGKYALVHRKAQTAVPSGLHDRQECDQKCVTPLVSFLSIMPTRRHCCLWLLSFCSFAACGKTNICSSFPKGYPLAKHLSEIAFPNTYLPQTMPPFYWQVFLFKWFSMFLQSFLSQKCQIRTYVRRTSKVMNAFEGFYSFGHTRPRPTRAKPGFVEGFWFFHGFYCLVGRFW